MDATTAGLLGVIAAQIATLITMYAKNQSESRRDRDRVTEETARELRQRQWVVEDRNQLRSEVKDASTALATKVDETRRIIAEKVEQSEVEQRSARQTILELLAQHQIELQANTLISTNAFHEANGAKQLLAEEVAKRNLLQQPPARPRRSTDPDPSAPGEPTTAAVAATQELAAQTGHAAEATQQLAQEIGALGSGGSSGSPAPIPPHAADDAHALATRALGVATAQLLIEVADRAKGIEQHTADSAETLHAIAQRQKG